MSGTMRNDATPNVDQGAIEQNGLGRRDVLRGLGLGAGAVATAPLASAPVAASETGGERTKARYRETEHVKTFYRTNRY